VIKFTSCFPMVGGIMYVQAFKTDVFGFICNIIMCFDVTLTNHFQYHRYRQYHLVRSSFLPSVVIPELLCMDHILTLSYPRKWLNPHTIYRKKNWLYIMMLQIKPKTSVLNACTYIIISITAIRLSAILVIMSVSTYNTVIILSRARVAQWIR
jgi:hypothetical protein